MNDIDYEFRIKTDEYEEGLDELDVIRRGLETSEENVFYFKKHTFEFIKDKFNGEQSPEDLRQINEFEEDVAEAYTKVEESFMEEEEEIQTEQRRLSNERDELEAEYRRKLSEEDDWW